MSATPAAEFLFAFATNPELSVTPAAESLGNPRLNVSATPIAELVPRLTAFWRESATPTAELPGISRLNASATSTAELRPDAMTLCCVSPIVAPEFRFASAAIPDVSATPREDELGISRPNVSATPAVDDLPNVAALCWVSAIEAAESRPNPMALC